MTIHLHIDAEGLHFRATPQATAVTLPLGLQALRRDLPRFPPGEPELENAIAHVEDVLMPQIAAIRQLAPLPLASGDAVYRTLAEVAGVPPHPGTLLDLDAVERVFNRLASVAGGRPARHEGLPEDLDLATALVVLREVMHHAGFPALRLDGP